MPYLLTAGSRVNRIWWRKHPCPVLMKKEIYTTQDCIIYGIQFCGARDEADGERMFVALRDREQHISLKVNDEYGIDVNTIDMIKIL